MEHTCDNCKYYTVHYVINKSKLSKVGGHCTHDKILPYTYRTQFKVRTNCKYWENVTENIQSRHDRILNDLHAMKVRLDEIAQILALNKE